MEDVEGCTQGHMDMLEAAVLNGGRPRPAQEASACLDGSKQALVGLLALDLCRVDVPGCHAAFVLGDQVKYRYTSLTQSD